MGLLLLAAACTREPGISPGDGNSDPAGASRNSVMSMERLQELALELPDDFSDGLSTRSGRKMIREVVPVTDFIDGSLLEPFAASVAASGTKAAVTRAGGVDPADASPGSLSAEADVAATLGRIYVVNYEADAGFAILSADRQLPSVLGYADSGNITDTMTNPGVKLFLERMADFVRRIGDNVDMSYHCDKSGASIQAAKRALKNYGFHTDDICSYSLERVRAEIDANHPLFISGYPTSGGDGHAWVIDGYVHGYYPTEVFMDVYDSNGNLLRGYYLGIENEYHDFVHCNWGWDGDGNGYFLHTWLFPKSPEIPDAGTGHADVSIRPYTNDLKIIKGIWR